MNKFHQGLLFYGIIFAIGAMVGGMMLSFIFFATIKFVAIVAVVETIKPIKWLAYRFPGLFDTALFVLAFYLMFTAGVTIGVSFTVTALMWTLVYKPYIAMKKFKRSQTKYKL